MNERNETKRTSQRNSLSPKKRSRQASTVPQEPMSKNGNWIEAQKHTQKPVFLWFLSLTHTFHLYTSSICMNVEYTWAPWKHAALNEEIPTHNCLFYLRYSSFFSRSSSSFSFVFLRRAFVPDYIIRPSNIIIRITHSVHFMFRSFGHVIVFVCLCIRCIWVCICVEQLFILKFFFRFILMHLSPHCWLHTWASEWMRQQELVTSYSFSHKHVWIPCFKQQTHACC